MVNKCKKWGRGKLHEHRILLYLPTEEQVICVILANTISVILVYYDYCNKTNLLYLQVFWTLCLPRWANNANYSQASILIQTHQPSYSHSPHAFPVGYSAESLFLKPIAKITFDLI